MSSVISNSRTKGKCQVFTASNVVRKMMGYLGYEENLYGKKILENSFGDGSFLKEIVHRYIQDCISNNISPDGIKVGLSSDIYGIELDATYYTNCLKALDSISESYNIFNVKWSIFNRDALREPIDEKFDYIIGNPPYVSYWDMDASERKYVKETYSTCGYGAYDYSFAFIEDCLSRLGHNGKMVYIVPNSIFKTRAGKELRKLLLKNTVAIYDYTTKKAFDSVLTTPAIIVVDCTDKKETIVYHDISNEKTTKLEKKMISDIWVFTDENFTCQSSRPNRFGDYFNVATSIATQCNEAFVLSDWTVSEEWLSKGEEKVECNAVRRAASPKGMKRDMSERIIFPYYYCNGVFARYSESEYKGKFPHAYKYLLAKKSKLKKRTAEKNSQWFEYGRSQALNHINTEKILISTIVTGKISIYKLDEDVVPYSGLYITVKDRKDRLSLDDAKRLLISKDFHEYVRYVGINANGESIRISARNICDYRW